MHFRKIISLIHILCQFLLHSVIIYLNGQNLTDKIINFIYIFEGSKEGHLDFSIEISFASTTESTF